MVHCFEKNGVNIILDVNSGAIHLVDKLTADICQNLSAPLNENIPEKILRDLTVNYSENDIKSAYSEIYELYQNGTLFSDDFADNLDLDISKDRYIKALCLNIAHDCNMRCGYCFASTGDFGTGRKIMPLEVAKAAIDFVAEKSGPRKNIDVEFFGGEPLMAFDSVKETVEYAKEVGSRMGKNFRFTITTNGLLLDDERIDYINREMYNVVLSLDGRREVNDAVRKTVSGSGSYDIILPKFKRLVSKRGKDKQYYIRGTFTAKNLDFANDIIAMADNGFNQIAVEPVVSKNTEYQLKEEHLPQIFEQYDILMNEIAHRRKQGNGFELHHFMLDLNGGPCLIKRLRGCGIGTEYAAVTPEGDIYPCHQFIGNAEFKEGNVLTGEFNTKIPEIFAKRDYIHREECSSCWAKFFCSGGCSASNYSVNGDINKPYSLSCKMKKKRLECAIYLNILNMLEE